MHPKVNIDSDRSEEGRRSGLSEVDEKQAGGVGTYGAPAHIELPPDPDAHLSPEEKDAIVS